MTKIKGKWEYEKPVIQSGDTTVVRRNLSNPGLTQRVYLSGPASSVTTTYYDMNGNGNSQNVPTQNPRQVIRETREVIQTTPEDGWEQKEYTLEDLKKYFKGKVKSFLGINRNGGTMSYFDYID